MGTWGTAIFSDDTASDVRNDFRELIGDGLSPEEATARLMTRYGSIVDDPEGGTTFWLGLAVTQWKSGRLQESVKKRALEIKMCFYVILPRHIHWDRHREQGSLIGGSSWRRILCSYWTQTSRHISINEKLSFFINEDDTNTSAPGAMTRAHPSPV